MAHLSLAVATSHAAEAFTPVLMEHAAKGALVLVAAWGATALMRRSSAAARHLVWCLAVVGVLVLPALSLAPGWKVLPAWSQKGNRAELLPLAPATVLPPSAPGDATVAPSAATTIAPEPRAVFDRPVPAPTVGAAWRLTAAQWLLAVWLLGVLVVLSPVIIGRVLLRRLERRSAIVADAAWLRLLQQARGELRISRPVRLLLSITRTMPMTWGLARPRLLLPADAGRWPSDRRRVVLLHELAHIKRWDCLTHLLAQLARALNWFNPLAWLAAHRLQTERERACDDLVLRLGARAPDYAFQLVEVAAGLRIAARGAAAMAMARPSSLEGRVREILDTGRNRAGVTLRATVAAATITAAFAVTLASLKSATASTKPAPAAAPAPIQPSDRSDEYKAASERMQMIQWAVWNYASEHENHWPPDLGASLPYMEAGKGLTAAQRARLYLSPRDEATKQVPENPTAEWVNQNTSYVYLGVPDWSSRATHPDTAFTVWLHESLDRGYSAGPGKPDVFPLAMVQAAVIPVDWAQAQWLVATSKATWEALRTGGSLPAHQQASWDARMILQAIDDYAREHDGVLPPDLGATLAYIPTDRVRTPTPAQKAAVFLSPHRKQTTVVPQKPTAEWVNRNTSYVYLGGSVRRTLVPAPTMTVLFYSDPAEHSTVMGNGGMERPVVPYATAHGHTSLTGTNPQTNLAGVAAHSREIFDLLRSGGPLPDYEHELRDLRILVQAVRAYAKANGDVLPPSLGQTIAYVAPADCPTPSDVARAYLSPSAERTTAIPAEPTAEWVNQHASYHYLGGPGLTLRKVASRTSVILHADLKDESKRPWFGGTVKVVPSINLRGDPLAGDVRGTNVDQLRDMIAETKSFLTTSQDASAMPESMAVSHRLRQVGQLIIAYAQKHDGRFPADLGATLDYASDTDDQGKPLTPAERVRVYLSPRDEKTVQVPERATREWVNQNTSFVYLGNDAVSWSLVPEWGRTVVVSVDLERDGFASEPEGEAKWYPQCMVDNHVDLLTRPVAAWHAAESRKTFEAIRDGAPFPDREQAIWDLRQIVDAMGRYTKEHEGLLPPTLGALLPHVTKDSPRLATAADRARVFLSPAAKRTVRVPERPTAEWVDRNATYIYLGGADVARARIAHEPSTVIVHGRIDEPYTVMGGDGRESSVFPIATVRRVEPAYGLERLQPAIEQSEKVLAAARGAGELPEYYHALRDVRLITEAARAYAKDHGDELPADLGSMLEYVPVAALPAATASERAKVFLSPKAEATLRIPEAPTPEWVNKNASYTYLGGPGILMSKIRQGPCIIVHADPNDGFEVSDLQGTYRRVPVGDIFGGIPQAWGWMESDLEWRLLDSKKFLGAARAGDR